MSMSPNLRTMLRNLLQATLALGLSAPLSGCGQAAPEGATEDTGAAQEAFSVNGNMICFYGASQQLYCLRSDAPSSASVQWAYQFSNDYFSGWSPRGNEVNWYNCTTNQLGDNPPSPAARSLTVWSWYNGTQNSLTMTCAW